MSNAKSWNEFLSERELYVVEPLTKTTDSWKTLYDVGDKKKANVLDFDTLKGKNLYVVFVRKDNRTCAKLYITDNNKNASILYIRSTAVNPVRTYRHVTKRKP